MLRGWCLTTIKAFRFLKAAKDGVRLNVGIGLTSGALSGRFEIGKRNRAGRERFERTAAQWNGISKRPLSARTHRFPLERRFVWPVVEARRQAGQSKRRGMASDGDALRFSATLFQLPFPKPFDLLVLALGDCGQRQDVRPGDFGKLLEGKTQLLGPFGNGARNLAQISDAPFGSITDQ